MSEQKRPYRKRARAEHEAQTRRRITESAVELHGTIGPARTSISAVAERAGVRRSTVYRHFPDEAALFEACSTHWAVANPVPDLAEWGTIEDPDARLQAALGELYGFYRRNESMLANLYRDESTVPTVADRFTAVAGYVAAARGALVRGGAERGRARRRAAAAVGHALAFATWRSLVRDQGLDDAEAADLMGRLVRAR